MADPYSMAMMAVAQVGISYLFPSEGPRLKDLKISASTYGAAIPWVFGLTRVPGNMIWSMPIREKKKKKSAGKGGFYNEYTYFCTFAMGLCQGPVREIRRIWADNKLIYDATGGVSPSQATQPTSIKELVVQRMNATGTSKYRMRFYRGDEDQLPDSAVETNLGEGNAPAFRGLAYILFDDMPLEDFGNRIPQITAEVMVGEQSTTVNVTPLREQDGQTELGRQRAAGEAVFDFARAVFYLRYDDAIKSISLRDGRARTLYAGDTQGYPQGERLNRLLCGGPDGSLFTLFGPEGGPNAMARLDPFSLQRVATHTPSLQYVRAAPATSRASAMRLLAVNDVGDACIHDAATLDVLWSGALGVGARLVGREPTDITAAAIFYVVRPGAGGLLKLSRVTVEGVEDLAEIEGTEVGPILWDSGMPGVLIFLKRGTQAYLVKWNEDTATVAWTRAIPGYPPIIAPESRTLESQIGWLVDGRVYMLDTATGTPLDGEDAGEATGTPDWADYLVRYPYIVTQYYDFGWAYADSPEAYAQYDYMSGGQAEGRTVNLIAGTQGQGIPLKEPYEGGVAALQAIDAARGLLIALDGVDGVVKATNIATGVSVGTIVARLLEEGGLPLIRTDLAALYALPIRGYGWASATDIKGVLDELRRVFLFDLVERDGLLVATMRSDDTNGLGVPIEVIPQNALGSSSADATDFWSETRTQESDLPSRVTFSYMNVDRDFETTTAHSTRIAAPVPTMFSRQQVSMEINIVMAAQEAKVQVHKMLYAQWAERTRHSTFLPWSYLALDPGDTINVRMNDGRLYEDRISRTEIGADFTMATECYSQDSGAYDGWEDLSADGGAGAGSTGILPPGLALPFVFNTPLMRDTDDQGGSASIYYVGLGNGVEQAWNGGALARSINNLDYEGIPTPESDLEWGTVIGDALPPPPFGAYALDWTTRLTIRPAVDWFAIESITDDELWAGANLAIVGDEIIQFRDCVENEDGTWTIWNLLRARRGTVYACDAHVAGERFVFLSAETVGFAIDQTSARGQVRYFKALASGGSLTNQGVLTLTYEPRDLMPYPPTDLRRAKAQASNDVTVTWSRCTRFGGNMQNGTGEVPLVERVERYEAYVLEAPFAGDRSRGRGPETYRRRYETASPQFVYDAAAQAEDGFDPLTDTLHLVIYQMSDAVGRGFPGARSVEPDEAF